MTPTPVHIRPPQPQWPEPVTLCGAPITDRDMSARDARNIRPGSKTAAAWNLCERCHLLANERRSR